MYTVFFCCTPAFVSFLEKQLVYHDQCGMKLAAVKDGTHYATDMQPCTFPYTFFLALPTRFSVIFTSSEYFHLIPRGLRRPRA